LQPNQNRPSVLDSSPESITPLVLNNIETSGLLDIMSNLFIQPDLLPVIFIIVGIVVSICLSAIVSASEVAIFSLGDNEILLLSESKGKKDEEVLRLLDQPKHLLAAILIANNFINILIVILFSYLSISLFDFTEYPALGFAFEVIVVTTILVLLGEITPKVYANQHALAFSRRMAVPLKFLNTSLYYFSHVLVKSTTFIDKRIKRTGHELSVDELNDAIELTSDNKEEDETDILRGIVNFGTISSKQIMTARLDISAVDIEIPFSELIELINEEGYSRMPVFEDSLDSIKGFLYIKDLLKHVDESDFKWQTLVREGYFIPENKKIDDLLKEFQGRRMHMAVVIDEYGGTSGLVTLEDILEEIVGEINDETDDLADDIKYSKLDSNNFVFEAKILINDLYKIMSLDDLPFDGVRGDADTLGGLILEISGSIPQMGDKIDLEDYRFTVESVDKKRIKRVKVSLNNNKESVNDN
jgi:putative hemolysin